MAYWWVSQNQSYQQERKGQFLWAPTVDRSGHTPYHWGTMNEVRAGDVIFSYVGQSIVSVAVAKSQAYPSPRPHEFNAEDVWTTDGKRIDVLYEDLDPTLYIPALINEFVALLPDKYSPLTKNGTGVQGYLFGLPARAGRFLLDQMSELENIRDPDPVATGVEGAVERNTERTALARSRVGQGQFRSDLMKIWSSRCCVTGLDIADLLRASHIKPWRDSDNLERLDPYNGLLLSPAYDAAFDAGFITFSDDGHILMSRELTKHDIERLALNEEATIRGFKAQHLKYLAHHRSEVFRG